MGAKWNPKKQTKAEFDAMMAHSKATGANKPSKWRKLASLATSSPLIYAGKKIIGSEAAGTIGTAVKKGLAGTEDTVKQSPIVSPQQAALMNQAGDVGFKGIMDMLGQGQQGQQAYQPKEGDWSGAFNNFLQGVPGNLQGSQGMGGLNGLGGASGMEPSSSGGGWGNLVNAGLSAAGGALFGPLGAVGGQALGSLGNWLFSDDKSKNQGQMDPMTYQQALSQLGGAAPQNQFNFQPIAQQEINRFNEQIAPGIARQFAGVGAQNSGAYNQTLKDAGQGLAGKLAAMGQEYGLQNFSQNEAARLSQQNAALGYLQNQQGFGQNQQKLGQGQQYLNLQGLTGMGQLGQGQQKINYLNQGNKQSLYQGLMSAGLQPQFQNNMYPGKQGLLEKFAPMLAEYGMKYALGKPF